MANDMTESERMAKHETKLETIEMVLMRLEAKVDAWQANFVSKELLDEKLRARDREIERLNQEIQRLEKDKAQKDEIERLDREKTSFKNNLPFWVTAVLAAISIIISLWVRK